MADNFNFKELGLTLEQINARASAEDKYNGILKNRINLYSEISSLNEKIIEDARLSYINAAKNNSERRKREAEDFKLTLAYQAALQLTNNDYTQNIKKIIEDAKLAGKSIDFSEMYKASEAKIADQAKELKEQAIKEAQNRLNNASTPEEAKKATDELALIQKADYTKSTEAYKTTKALLDANGPKERSTIDKLTSDPKQFVQSLIENSAAKKLEEKYANLATATTDEERAQIVSEIQGIKSHTAGFSTAIAGVATAINKLGSSLTEAVTETTTVYKTYMGKMNAHLEGTGKTFNSINDTVSNAYAYNSLVSQKSLIENVATLANDGIMYNIEERALLNSLSGRILDTFSVTNAHLTSLIRILQADLTQSQLGIETAINRFLNSTFLDSSYLQGTYDTVYGAILDANSMLSYEQTADFSYAVQKWLGSLYSVGVDQGTVTNIASGLNALATGDISKISGNVLFTASAANAGLDLAEMMTSGIDSSDINKLMTSMVKYLLQIALSTADNNITRQAYAGIVNMSVADIAAILNLSSSMIESISNTNMTYQDTMNETQYQLSQVASRTTLAEKIDNALNNVMYTWGMNISNDTTNYALWRGGDLIKTLGTTYLGGATTTAGKVAMALGAASMITAGGRSLVESILQGISSSKTGAGLGNIALFDWDQTVLSRGGDTTGMSYSGLIKSASTKTSKTLADNIVDTNTVALSESDYTKTADDLYTALFVDNKAVHVYVDDISKTAIDLTAINAIKNKLEDGVIRVDIEDNDINTLTSTLSALRQSF